MKIEWVVAPEIIEGPLNFQNYGFDISNMDAKSNLREIPKGKVVNLAVYRAQKSLREEGFDLVMNDEGKLTLVLRLSKPTERRK